MKLRHPGKNDRNVTRDHNWAIYVNPVGVDAAVQTQDTRCVAGGYIWNPFFTQLADPLNVCIIPLRYTQIIFKSLFIGRSLQTRMWARKSFTLSRR